MRRGFLMISDAIIALIIISLSTVIINQLLSEQVSYQQLLIHEVTRDAAALIEEKGQTQTIIDSTSNNICLKAIIKHYDGTNYLSQEEYNKTGCGIEGSEIKVTHRTSLNQTITVKGWFN